MTKTFIMCAGKSERYGKSYPKVLEPILGEPNYKRTIRLLKENGIEAIITVSKENIQYFDYENKIIGSNEREIDRFRNIRNYFEKEALILYGDVVYHEADIKIILNNLFGEINFFGRFLNNFSDDITYGEILAIHIFNKDKFFNAVDKVALNFENKLINREIGLDVFKELQMNKTDMSNLSEYTDDFDMIQKYNSIKELYENKIVLCTNIKQ